jgi:hypothetical protein
VETVTDALRRRDSVALNRVRPVLCCGSARVARGFNLRTGEQSSKVPTEVPRFDFATYIKASGERISEVLRTEPDETAFFGRGPCCLPASQILEGKGLPQVSAQIATSRGTARPE